MPNPSQSTPKSVKVHLSTGTGMDIEWIVNLRRQNGDPLILFGPMEVTTTLHNASPGEIYGYVRQVMDLCRDRACLDG